MPKFGFISLKFLQQIYLDGHSLKFLIRSEQGRAHLPISFFIPNLDFESLRNVQYLKKRSIVHIENIFSSSRHSKCYEHKTFEKNYNTDKIPS